MCKQEFGQYGFKSYRTNHYRVINDIFQSFNLHRSVSGHDCIVEFTVAPLCCGELNKMSCVPHHIKQFERSVFPSDALSFTEKDGPWFWYERTDEGIQKVIQEMSTYMHKYLMPYFEESDNNENAYYALLKLEELFYRNSTEYGRKHFDEYRAEIKSKYGVDYEENFGIKADYAMKMGDYDLVVKYLKIMEAQWLDAYEANCNLGNPDPQYVERMENKLLDLRKKIKRFSDKDTEYIKNLIQYNECKSLSSLGLLQKYT